MTARIRACLVTLAASLVMAPGTAAASDRRGDRIELRRQTLELHRTWRALPAAGSPGPGVSGEAGPPVGSPPVMIREPVVSPRSDAPLLQSAPEQQDGEPTYRLNRAERDLLRRQLRQRAGDGLTN